jgi:uncharacterized protein with HEPN domain
MITAPMLNLIQESGESVLVLTDGLEESEFLRSRLTREETGRQLVTLADTLEHLPQAVQAAMPEIDWDGWRATRTLLGEPGRICDEAMWFAARSMVPATLSWLRVYRQSHPDLFVYWP